MPNFALPFPSPAPSVFRLKLFPTLVLCSLTPPLAAQSPDLLQELIVLSRRESGPPPTHTWEDQDLRRTTTRTLDELLASDPSFSLYRRQSSTFGNPTSSGVSLRNTGATAASRTLVTLDGIPQNDPFGGWIYWGRYQPTTLQSARILPSAAATAWGSLSPAGLIQLESESPFQDIHRFRLAAGSFESLSASTFHQWHLPDSSTSLGFSAFRFSSMGFNAITRSQRGPIDEKLSLDTSGTSFHASWLPSSHLQIDAALSLYQEKRHNGTPLTRNATNAFDASLRITSDDPAGSWQLLHYYQQRSFSAFFSSVNPSRTAETPSLDQFHVPGQAFGSSWTFRRNPSEKVEWQSGLDLRYADGATHEDATWNGSTFTRRRIAGGSQWTTGAFSSLTVDATDNTRLSGTLRADSWSLTHSRRRERSLLNGSLLRSDRTQDRSDFEPSASLALEQKLPHHLTASFSLSSSWRLPNLNELHRPFRVRNDIVEANPDLDPERFNSAQATLTWSPHPSFSSSTTFFHHTIHDAIANVPITDPSAITAIFGSIPPGGSGSQRRNVPEARVSGLQQSFSLLLPHETTLEVDAVLSDTRYTRPGSQPLLNGKPFPQNPDQRLTSRLRHPLTPQIGVELGAEYSSHQYDDSLGRRRIPSAWTLHLGAEAQLSPNLTTFLRIDNLLNQEIPTGLSSDGIRSTGQPRSLWIGAEWNF